MVQNSQMNYYYVFVQITNWKNELINSFGLRCLMAKSTHHRSFINLSQCRISNVNNTVLYSTAVRESLCKTQQQYYSLHIIGIGVLRKLAQNFNAARIRLSKLQWFCKEQSTGSCCQNSKTVCSLMSFSKQEEERTRNFTGQSFNLNLSLNQFAQLRT